MGIGINVTEIVQRDDLKLTSSPTFVQGTQHISADPAIPIDRNLYWHLSLLT
jgi:hypothetical protein